LGVVCWVRRWAGLNSRGSGLVWRVKTEDPSPGLGLAISKSIAQPAEHYLAPLLRGEV
jgi:hypothetical protein